MQKVLIAGGCGFIGHRVANLFLKQNYQVFIVDNYLSSDLSITTNLDHYKLRLRSLCGAKIIDADICNVNKINTLFNRLKPNLVVHLANCPSAKVVNSEPFLYGEQIINGTLSLLQASLSNNVCKFVYVSSSMIYGDFLSSVINEDHPINPIELYGTFKAASESIIRSYTKSHALCHAIIRPIAVYGPTGHTDFVITKYIKATKQSGCIVVNGIDNCLSFTYVDDVAYGIYLAAISSKAINETFNTAIPVL